VRTRFPRERWGKYGPALYAAAGKGEFAAFYRRLVDNGKRSIVAVATVMRKIIVTLNARLRDAEIAQS
jgi:transposase